MHWHRLTQQIDDNVAGPTKKKKKKGKKMNSTTRSSKLRAPSLLFLGNHITSHAGFAQQLQKQLLLSREMRKLPFERNLRADFREKRYHFLLLWVHPNVG